MIRLLLGIAVVMLPSAAWGAQTGPQAVNLGADSSKTAPQVPKAPPTPENGSDRAQIVPVKKGVEAPFTGLLVLEARFVELLAAENRVRELEAKLAAHERTATLVEQVYLRKLDQATAPIPWYEGATFNRWLGFGLGLAAAGLAVWGAVEIAQEVK